MSLLKRIFDVFSRRPEATTAVRVRKPLTSEFRGRVLLLCHDLFPEERGGYVHQYWSEIHRMLQYRHGRPVLYTKAYPSSSTEDVLMFLQSCNDEHFLDFIEYIFKVKTFFHSAKSEQHVVTEINQLFSIDDLPYALTDVVRRTTRQFSYGSEHDVSEVVAYPKVIRKESETLHSAAIQPSLDLLANPAFASANEEFRAALDDYRKGDFRDCLVKCGSAFESVLKVICDQKGWSYTQKDTAQVLLNNVLPRTGLDPFFNQPLMLVATIRNRLSTAHGSGTQVPNVPAYVAQYAINATASAILLIYDSTI
jgi:hypothetical protein